MDGKKTDFDDLLKTFHKGMEEMIPFNKMIGLTLESISLEKVCVKVEMRDDLIGNSMLKTLHGGVIASVLDVAGGATAMVAKLKLLEDKSGDEIFQRMSKIGTIDLRLDYLSPGWGKYFIATGTTLRTCNVVAVARIELHNDQKKLIAVGTGTYKVG